MSEGDTAMAAGVLVCFNGLLRPVEAMLTTGQCTLDLDVASCTLTSGTPKEVRDQARPSMSSSTSSRQLCSLQNYCMDAQLGPSYSPAGRAAFAVPSGDWLPASGPTLTGTSRAPSVGEAPPITSKSWEVFPRHVFAAAGGTSPRLAYTSRTGWPCWSATTSVPKSGG